MKIATYDKFVIETDQSVGRPLTERMDIAIYGLAGEIGSLVAAIKKRLLGERGKEDWAKINEEILEELGDILWYGFALARVANERHPVNIFAHDIRNLKSEIEAPNARGARLRGVLDPTNCDEFLKRASDFPKTTRVMTFEDYQSLAFLTARTGSQTLVEVCLAVLWQLSAQLLRRKLPPIELELNRAVADRPLNDLLGEIAWHVAAIASIYGVGLSEVAASNMNKVAFRSPTAKRAALHDDAFIESQQLPRQFNVAFVSVSPTKCRMYFGGKQLGDDLTDNSYADDGYRYHDIMHLANVAKLGWSPVLRSLLGRKRKSVPETDEVEDGARARIVEEAVIKAIHSEGERVARLRGATNDARHQLFATRSEITFTFLKFVRTLVRGLEVEKNYFWEWEEAILAGHHIFNMLRNHRQGTVTVDMERRTIEFTPDVCVSIQGRVAGLGSAAIELDSHSGATGASDLVVSERRRAYVQELAILSALGLSAEHLEGGSIRVKELATGVSVTATGQVQDMIWQMGIVSFRTTLTTVGSSVHCTAIAVSDPA